LNGVLRRSSSESGLSERGLFRRNLFRGGLEFEAVDNHNLEAVLFAWRAAVEQIQVHVNGSVWLRDALYLAESPCIDEPRIAGWWFFSISKPGSKLNAIGQPCKLLGRRSTIWFSRE
jgi:hypothetical protein